jgi:hypothetical protein
MEIKWRSFKNLIANRSGDHEKSFFPIIMTCCCRQTFNIESHATKSSSSSRGTKKTLKHFTQSFIQPSEFLREKASERAYRTGVSGDEKLYANFVNSRVEERGKN